MNEHNSRQEYEKLIQDINFHNYRYYILNSPVISDYEYDQLIIRLREFESLHPEWITPDSPSQRLGGQLTERFIKVQHPSPILSLASVTDLPGVQAWYERISKIDERVEHVSFTIEPKIDGLTVVLHYKNGVFVQGATRGDGEIGEDITSNLRTVKAVPLHIPIAGNGPQPPEYLVVRGEVFMFIKDFEKLNKQLEESGEKIYLNPRNTASGALRQLDPSLTASRPLYIYTYAIVRAEGNVPETQWETLQFLRNLGFPVSELSVYAANLEEVLQICDERLQTRDTLSFEADGIVIKINDLKLSADLGFVGKDPRGALALKYPAREMTTTLLEIRVNVGRTGVLTPYAVLEPVEIGGVVVKQATLHNFDYIAEKDIRVGDRVLIKRAGDVIPYVIGPVVDTRTGKEVVYQPPKICPACGQPVEHMENEVAWYCVNAACPAQLIRNLEHFVSRPAMDIAGLGIKIVEQLCNEGLVKDVSDLYKLRKEDLLGLEGFAEKKAENIINAINSSRERPLARLINALGIRGVGEVMAADLAQHYHDLDELSKVTIDDLQSIEGVGPNIAQAIVDWFTRPANQQLLIKLHSVGLWPTVESAGLVQMAGEALDGLTFVVTGILPHYGREDIKKLIRSNGGKVVDSVRKSTNYLVVGENPGSKLDKAKQLGVQQLNETGLLELISGNK